jgi:hypothetical protein
MFVKGLDGFAMAESFNAALKNELVHRTHYPTQARRWPASGPASGCGGVPRFNPAEPGSHLLVTGRFNRRFSAASAPFQPQPTRSV